MAKCKRESVAGGELGIIITSAYIYLACWAEKYNRDLKKKYDEGCSFEEIEKDNFEIAGQTVGSIMNYCLVNFVANKPVAYLADYTMERALQLNEVNLAVKGIHTINGLVFFRSLSTKKLRKIRLVITYTVGKQIDRKVTLLDDNMDCEEPTIEKSLIADAIFGRTKK